MFSFFPPFGAVSNKAYSPFFFNRFLLFKTNQNLSERKSLANLCGMKVRPAHKSDLTIIHQINEANTPHVSSVSLEWLEKYLKEAFYFNVIEFQRKVAGFMIAMLPDTDYQSENFLWFKKNYASFVYVDRIAIHPEHFKKGLGKALYKDLEQSMKTQSKVLTCEVNLRPENPRSLHFHQSLGFQEVGQLETKGGSVRVSLLGKTVNYY